MVYSRLLFICESRMFRITKIFAKLFVTEEYTLYFFFSSVM